LNAAPKPIAGKAACISRKENHNKYPGDGADYLTAKTGSTLSQDSCCAKAAWMSELKS
jgi:hypothetical protein